MEPIGSTPEQLACLSQEGCRESFGLLVDQFQEKIFNYLRQMTGNAHDAQDLTQETFIKAYKHIHKFSPTYSFSTWIFTIAKRTAYNHFRSRKFTEDIEDNPTFTEVDPSLEFQKKERAQSLWDLVKTLKPKQREALWLRYGEGFSIEETANIMKLTPVFVRVSLHRARIQLAEKWKRVQESGESGSNPLEL